MTIYHVRSVNVFLFIFMIKMATLERLLNGLEGEELIFKSAYKNILVQYHYYRFVVVFLPF